MFAIQEVDARKWLTAANLVLAGVAVLPALLALPTMLGRPTAAVDIDAVGYAWLAALICFPIATLLGLAATAHWRRWPLRWLLQALAFTLPVFLLVVALLSK